MTRPAEAFGVHIREAQFPDDLARIRALFEEYAAGLGIDLGFQGFAEELAGLPGRYARPAGGVWLAIAGDAVIGCVALRPLDAERAEVKPLSECQRRRNQRIAKTRARVEHVFAAIEPTTSSS